MSPPDPAEVPPLIAHLERHLGPIVRGAEDARLPGVSVVVFSDRPAPGATTYATLGLSHHLLTGLAGRQYRLELLGCSRAEFDALAPEGALLTVAEEMLARHAPLLRGQVVGPAGSIVPSSSLRAFYCTVPVCFPDALAQCSATEPPTVFAWLVPITADEAEFVAVHGWDAFEDLLEACQPDLLDLRRASVVQDQAKHQVPSRWREPMQPRELVQAWVEAFNRADVDALAGFYAEDAVNHQVAESPVHGRDAIRRMFAAEFASANMFCIVEHIFEDGEWAILEWRDPLGLKGCGFFHVVRGEIVFQRGYWDKLTFLRTRGLPLPDRP